MRLNDYNELIHAIIVQIGRNMLYNMFLPKTLIINDVGVHFVQFNNYLYFKLLNCSAQSLEKLIEKVYFGTN